VPVQCGEFLPSAEELNDLFHCPEIVQEAFDIPPESVLRTTHHMVCVAPRGARYRFPLEGFSVDRRSFDRRLAEAAVRAGAELRHPAGVTGIRDDVVTFASGIEVRRRSSSGPTARLDRGSIGGIRSPVRSTG